MYNEQEIIPILDKLGYDRVRDASQSFSPLESSPKSFFGCFLGRCYGDKGEFMNELDKEQTGTYSFIASHLHLNSAEADKIMIAYDNHFPKFSRTVSNWLLEHSPTKIAQKVYEPSQR